MKRDRGLRRPGTLQEVLRFSVYLFLGVASTPMSVGAGPASLSQLVWHTPRANDHGQTVLKLIGWSGALCEYSHPRPIRQCPGRPQFPDILQVMPV